MCNHGGVGLKGSGKMEKMRAIVVGGTHSGVGKTSIAVGLMAAFRKRGLRVQPYKVGPDFLDPMHHEKATGRESYNLDGWMLDRESNVASFMRHAEDTDIAVIEGVMGLYDGRDGKSEAGSTAEMAKMLGAPVVLALDCYSMARSVAAMVHGFTSFDPDLNWAGIIFNKVGGPAHVAWLREAVETAGIDIAVLGGIPKTAGVELPERHLGLLMPDEASVPNNYVELLGELVERHLDLDLILKLASHCHPFASLYGRKGGLEEGGKVHPAPLPLPLPWPVGKPVRIGVAKDAAFCFYYHENLTLLEEAGAELVHFSPLADTLPPRLDAVYLGGGYPELHAERLAGNARMLYAMRAFAAAGGIVYAECGGLMYLSQGIQAKDGKYHGMCGVLPFKTRMVQRMHMGYVTVTPNSSCTLFPPEVGTVRGQVYHFSEVFYDEGEEPERAEEAGGTTHGPAAPDTGYMVLQQTPGAKPEPEGYMVGNVLASYVHLHFGSNPAAARALVERCSRSSSPGIRRVMSEHALAPPSGIGRKRGRKHSYVMRGSLDANATPPHEGRSDSPQLAHSGGSGDSVDYLSSDMDSAWDREREGAGAAGGRYGGVRGGGQGGDRGRFDGPPSYDSAISMRLASSASGRENGFIKSAAAAGAPSLGGTEAAGAAAAAAAVAAGGTAGPFTFGASANRRRSRDSMSTPVAYKGGNAHAHVHAGSGAGAGGARKGANGAGGVYHHHYDERELDGLDTPSSSDASEAWETPGEGPPFLSSSESPGGSGSGEMLKRSMSANRVLQMDGSAAGGRGSGFGGSGGGGGSPSGEDPRMRRSSFSYNVLIGEGGNGGDGSPPWRPSETPRGAVGEGGRSAGGGSVKAQRIVSLLPSATEILLELAWVLLPPDSARENLALSVKHVASMPGFWNLPAVQQGQVFICQHDYFSRPGPRLVDGVEILAHLLHPSCFTSKVPPGAVLKLDLGPGQRCRPDEIHKHFQPYS
eukprot:jgi/Mesen1/1880/ME000143S00932